MKQAFLFDMDGTLVDSMNYWNNLKFRICELYEIRTGEKVALTPEERVKMESLSLSAAIKYINQNHRTAIDFKLDCFNDMANYYQNECQIKPFVREVLELLTDRGHKLAVCTATPKALAEKSLRAQGIDGFFKFILTPEQVKGGKFHKPIFWVSALKLRKRRRNVVLVDDAPYALKTAERAGLRTVAIRDRYREEKITTEGTLQCDGFEDLFEYLQREDNIL